MLDALTRLDFFKGFKGKAMPLFLFFDPCKQSLFDNPATRTFHAFGEMVDLLGQGRGDMGRQNAGLIGGGF